MNKTYIVMHFDSGGYEIISVTSNKEVAKRNYLNPQKLGYLFKSLEVWNEYGRIARTESNVNQTEPIEDFLERIKS